MWVGGGGRARAVGVRDRAISANRQVVRPAWCGTLVVFSAGMPTTSASISAAAADGARPTTEPGPCSASQTSRAPRIAVGQWWSLRQRARLPRRTSQLPGDHAKSAVGAKRTSMSPSRVHVACALRAAAGPRAVDNPRYSKSRCFSVHELLKQKFFIRPPGTFSRKGRREAGQSRGEAPRPLCSSPTPVVIRIPTGRFKTPEMSCEIGP